MTVVVCKRLKNERQTFWYDPGKTGTRQLFLASIIMSNTVLSIGINVMKVTFSLTTETSDIAKPILQGGKQNLISLKT